MKNTSLFGSLLLVAVATGCATAPPVDERTIATSAAIRAAGEVGAARVPRAALHLQLAREELGKAAALSANNEKNRAASLLLRAEADAELAVVLSREDAERSEAASAVERVRQLRQSN